MKTNLFALIISMLSVLACNFDKESTCVLLLENVNIIDVVGERLLENKTIEISRSGEIQNIIPSGSKLKSNKVTSIDLSGKYLIPGLIDGHVHLFRPLDREKILEDLLLSGITSVRDMGGDARIYQELNSKIKESAILSPNIYYSANLFGKEFMQDPRIKFVSKGYALGHAPWMRVITKETDLVNVMKEAKDSGVTGIKIYSSIDKNLLVKISKEAKKQNLKVWSHSTIFPSSPSDATAAGVEVLSHAVGLIAESSKSALPNSFLESIRNFIPEQDFRNANPNSEEYLNLFKQMVKADTYLEPTISSWNKPGQKTQSHKSKRKENPTVHMDAAKSKLDMEGMNLWAMRVTKAAYDNGVTISAGTDLNTNIKWVQDEVILLAECGLQKIHAIQAATINNAMILGVDQETGSIEVGKKADLLILNSNPLQKIDNLKDVHMVFKRGVRISIKKEN